MNTSCLFKQLWPDYLVSEHTLVFTDSIVFGNTPNLGFRRPKQKVCHDNRFTIRLEISLPIKVHCYSASKTSSSSRPSNRLSSLQSCYENLAAIFTWSYTKLTGISCPFGPRGPTRAYDSDQVQCTAFSPWPRSLVRLLGMLISSIARSSDEAPWINSRVPPYFLEENWLAIKP